MHGLNNHCNEHVFFSAPTSEAFITHKPGDERGTSGNEQESTDQERQPSFIPDQFARFYLPDDERAAIVEQGHNLKGAEQGRRISMDELCDTVIGKMFNDQSFRPVLNLNVTVSLVDSEKES